MVRRERLPRTAEIQNWLITVHERENPKRPGSMARERYEGYLPSDVKTVADAMQNGVRRDDLVWDRDHGFISISEPR